MASRSSPRIRRAESVSEIGRVADNQSVFPVALRSKGLEILAMNPDTVVPGRSRDILSRLSSRVSIDLDGIDQGKWIALSDHQSEESGTGPHIQDTMGGRAGSPCSEQDTVGADLHGTVILDNPELAKLKIGIGGHRQE